MTIRSQVSKKDLATNAYLNALIYFWTNSDTVTENGQKCKAMFDDYADIFWEIGDRFEGNEFSSPENQTVVVDDLDKLYYAIAELDPASDTLLLMCPAIDMLDDVEPTVRKCRR